MCFRAAPVLGLAIAAAALAPAAHAAAYCHSTTVDPASSCPEVCSDLGTKLRWARPELTFWLAQGGFPGFSDAALRGAVLSSFSAWEDVSCDGRPVEYRFDLAPGYTDEGAGHRREGPNISVLVYEDEPTWEALGHSSAAFAVTTVAYSRSTGAISEADIEFNGGMPTWTLCPPEGCGDDSHTDLENVLTHELGHTLGLAHSDVAGATMSCSAMPGETTKRTLSSDDIAAICGTYPPGRVFAGYRSAVQGVTCGVSSPARRPARGAAFALCLAALLRVATPRVIRRRRARRAEGA